MKHTVFTSGLLLGAALTLAAQASAEPEPAPPPPAEAAAPAEAAPQASASVLVERFAECFAAEAGAALSAEDLELLAAASGDLLGLVFGERCRGDGCEAALRETSCAALAEEMDAAMVVTPPDWAIALTDALIGRSTTCLETEAGRPPTAEEAEWLRQYRELMARQYVDMIQLLRCEVDTARVAACVDELRAMPCAEADPQALLSGLARTFSGACGEMFRCAHSPDLGAALPDDSDIDAILGAGRDYLTSEGRQIDRVLAAE